MRLRWTPVAASDLEDIRNYVDLHLPAFAQSTIQTIYREIQSLRRFPMRGRIGEVEGTRECWLTPLPYIVVYRVTDTAIEVIRIWHTAQDRKQN